MVKQARRTCCVFPVSGVRYKPCAPKLDPTTMPVSVHSDEDVQMDNRKAQGPSKRPAQEDADTAYGEAIEDNQGINEEYKIW